MNPAFAHAFLIAACMELFPAAYNTAAARAMLIAIALQESAFKHRQQLVGTIKKWWDSKNGPATSYWQIELPCISLLLEHRVAGPLLKAVLEKLGYPPIAKVIHQAIINNDILAVCCARLLLLTFPGPLPKPTEVGESWKQYIWCWRPGKPHRDTWTQNYTDAWLIEMNGSRDDSV